MSVSGIEGVGFTPFTPPQIPTAPSFEIGAGAPDFGGMVLDGLDRLDGVQKTADQYAVQAATGDLSNLHDYTIAATQAAVTTQVTVAIRNKAVEAFTEIMRMQV